MVSTGMFSAPKEVSEIFLRTRKCRFFGLGKCTRGSACKFAHTTEELRPRMNLACTKMCPMLLKKGSCTVDGCNYAHRAEDRRRRLKKHHQGSKEVSTGQFGLGRPSLCSLLFGDASPDPLGDKSTSEARRGGELVGEGRDDLMLKMQTANASDDVALPGSVKDVAYSEGFLHHGFLVSVKNTFIDVESAYVSSSVGLRRTLSAPGNISSTADIQTSITI